MSQSQNMKSQFGVEQSGDQEWVCVGMFAGAHGVRGDVRLKSFTDNPEDILSFKKLCHGVAGPLVSMKKRKTIKGGFAVAIDGVEDCHTAETMQNIKLFVPRDEFQDLGEDEFYLADLVGLEAVDQDAEPIGRVRSVENYGSDDLLEIALYSAVKGIGKVALIPFRKHWAPVVDITAKRVVLRFQEWIDTQVEVPTDQSKENAEKAKKKQ